MAYGGSLSSPKANAWGFIPTGPTQQVALGATSVTVTLTQFVSTAPYAGQCCFQASGAAAINSFAFVAFGSSTVTVAATVGSPIVSTQLMSQQAPSGGVSLYGVLEILTTGKTPAQYLAIGSAGTMTVWITPGEGRR